LLRAPPSGSRCSPKIWTAKATGPRPEDTRRRWSFRDARQQAYARGLPVGILALTALVLSMAAVLVEDATSGTLSAVARRSALWAFIAFVAFTLAAGSITLFNCPKFLVPPAARDEPGAIALWWRRAGALVDDLDRERVRSPLRGVGCRVARP
jgi:hypothetical protein